MVQILKESVRKNILLAAESQFAKSGFKRATIAAIAKKAGVATGNIYKYYSSKKELFEAVITEEFVDKFLRLTRNRIGEFEQSQGIDPCRDYMENRAGELLHFWIKNRRKTVILLAHAEGTRYEDFVRIYIQDMKELAIAQVRRQHPQIKMTDMLLFLLEKALTDSVRGIVLTLEHFDDEESILEAFGAGTAFQLGGLLALFEWASKR
ncbi:TetR/AcrR family transcriptional regulator [Maridesulfovibrio zosterae]|uniref:TetR/AcrR family transcriptional regulator n=1 Tax=Maridesulfovibrio zosterae TaxID=82171 RepID=UPI00041A34CF|nr:TetR/AcrR family transcriptional regulator [Maridesulfovibrio zosterae]